MTSAITRRPPVIWMTFLDGHDHAVTDEEAAYCTSGIYKTVCGSHLLPASSFARPRTACPRCRRLVLAMTPMRAGQQRSSRPRHCRESWWTRTWRARGKR